MKITFYGGAETVTGSCFMLKADSGETILVDCGLFQGNKEIRERNYNSFPFDPKGVDWVLLTHAHIDHSGLIPKLYKHGYTGKVITTHITRELCSVMLPDSGFIQEMEVERKNRKNQRAGRPLIEPIYTSQDAKNCIKYFQGVHYNNAVELNENVTVRFKDAGHILGSAIIEIWVKCNGEHKKITFTGDLGTLDKPIVNDPDLLRKTDFLVIESTYGGREHEDISKREEKLATIIQQTFRRGGNVVIPAFAVERTQDLLYDLNQLIKAGQIKTQDIFVDSPLAIAVTEIFCRNEHHFDEESKEFTKEHGHCPLLMDNLKFTNTQEESAAINNIKGGAIIISASGMCDAGRIRHHLKHNLWRENSTILFVGYQAVGTLGRAILDGIDKVKLFGEEIKVRAHIENIPSYSSHSDQEDLLEWIRQIEGKPELIFVVHGEIEGSTAFKELIEERFAIETHIPTYLQEFPLAPCAEPVVVHEDTKRVPIQLRERFEQIFDQVQEQAEQLLKEKKYEEAGRLLHKLQRSID